MSQLTQICDNSLRMIKNNTNIKKKKKKEIKKEIKLYQ